MSSVRRAGSSTFAPCSDRYGGQAINWRAYSVGEHSEIQVRQMQITVVISQAYGSFEIAVTAMAIRPVQRLLNVPARSSHPDLERAARLVMRSALRPSIGSAIFWVVARSRLWQEGCRCFVQLRSACSGDSCTAITAWPNALPAVAGGCGPSATRPQTTGIKSGCVEAEYWQEREVREARDRHLRAPHRGPRLRSLQEPRH